MGFEVGPEIRASSDVKRLWWLRVRSDNPDTAKRSESQTQKTYPEFKARVALDALKGIKTVQQIAKEFEVHSVQASDWKKKLSAQAGSVFETGRQQEQENFSAERTDLHSKIGELTVKMDFVVKKSMQLGVWSGLPDSSKLNTRN